MVGWFAGQSSGNNDSSKDSSSSSSSSDGRRKNWGGGGGGSSGQMQQDGQTGCSEVAPAVLRSFCLVFAGRALRRSD